MAAVQNYSFVPRQVWILGRCYCYLAATRTGQTSPATAHG